MILKIVSSKFLIKSQVLLILYILFAFQANFLCQRILFTEAKKVIKKRLEESEITFHMQNVVGNINKIKK